MEQMKFLQVPGWDHILSTDVKPSECSCKLTNGYTSKNNNLNNNSPSGSNFALSANARCSCDSSVINANDKYTAAIELSNKCREFYNSRLEAANSIKSRWCMTPYDKSSPENSSTSSPLPPHSPNDSSSSSSSSSSSISPSSSTSSLSGTSSNGTAKDNDNSDSSEPLKSRRQNSIDVAMDRLRTEMVSLMEQDLSLMKQLLTLNETIEELKWQRQYYSCSTSCASLSPSGHFHCRAGDTGSAWSVSDTEMYESEDDLRLLTSTGPDESASTASNVTAPSAVSTTAPSSGTVTPRSSSSASLAMVQHHVQPPATGHVTGPTWHSTRMTRKVSLDSDRVSLDSLSFRFNLTDDGEEGLAAEVQAALRKMENGSGKNGDTTIFPGTFVDSYCSRPALSTEKGKQRDGQKTRQSVSCKVTPASPVSTGKSFKFTADHLDLTPGPIIRHDRDQHSFDSGIHEPALSEEIVWNV